MAECRDFFEDSSYRIPRSSTSSDTTSVPAPPEGMEEVGEDCLELTLGLGPSVGACQASGPLNIAPPSVYTCLSKQHSGNFASSAPFVPTSDFSQTSFPHVDAPQVHQNFSRDAEATAVAKQRSGNFAFAGEHTHPSFGGQAEMGLAVNTPFSSGDTAFQSRDQIWLTLQRNGVISGQDSQNPNDILSMWGRRAASMHAPIPHKDGDDAVINQVRRSSSSGIFPLRALRQISSIEFSLEKSPQQSVVCSQDHDQEALKDLWKRKEMQAQRRQVARKRRKILIEEKQHKKSKQSSCLQRLGSRQSISPNDKLSLGGTATGEDGVTQDSHRASPDASKQESQGKARKGMTTVHDLLTEETKQETHSQCAKDDKADTVASAIDEAEGPSHFIHPKGGMSMHGHNTACTVPIKGGASNGLSHEHNSGSHSSMIEQSISVCNKKFPTTGTGHDHGSLHDLHAAMVTTVCTGAHMNEDEGGKSSETDCVESCSTQNDAKLLQTTSEKVGVGPSGSSASSTAPLSSNSASYPSFPFMAVPYAYTVAGATPTAIPMQPGFPFPFLVQYPSHCDNNVSPLRRTCSIVSGTTPGTPFPGVLISNASSASKDWMGESFEGKGGCGDKPAFNALSRTASNLLHVKEEPQGLGVHLESQATFSASQLSSISSVASDACNTKNLLLERQQSVAFEGRLLSQNSYAQDQSTTSSKQERPILSQRGVDAQHEMSALRMGGSKTEAKQVEGVLQGEGIVESSQLGSELSGMQSVERQRSGSFLDLPWVTTTGKGPNGKTINGVLYMANGRHVRLICSCHGKHMSAVEFVEHSGSTDLSNPERSIVVCPFPSLIHQ